MEKEKKLTKKEMTLISGGNLVYPTSSKSIVKSGGAAGSSSNINIRGIASINGDTEPLFIIDGSPVKPL